MSLNCNICFFTQEISDKKEDVDDTDDDPTYNPLQVQSPIEDDDTTEDYTSDDDSTVEV